MGEAGIDSGGREERGDPFEVGRGEAEGPPPGLPVDDQPLDPVRSGEQLAGSLDLAGADQPADPRARHRLPAALERRDGDDLDVVVSGKRFEEAEVAPPIGAETEVGPLDDRRGPDLAPEDFPIEGGGRQRQERPIDRLDKDRIDAEIEEKPGTAIRGRKRRRSGAWAKDPSGMGIEGQHRGRQPETPADLEEPGDDCGMAEMDAVKVADGHRAGSAARLPTGASGKQTRGGKVRQGREEYRGNEDCQTTVAPQRRNRSECSLRASFLWEELFVATLSWSGDDASQPMNRCFGLSPASADTTDPHHR